MAICENCNPLLLKFCEINNLCANSSDDKIDANHLPPSDALSLHRDGVLKGTTFLAGERAKVRRIGGTGKPRTRWVKNHPTE